METIETVETTETIYNETTAGKGNDIIRLHEFSRNTIVNGSDGFDYLWLNGNSNEWSFMIDTEKGCFTLINSSTGQDVIINSIECLAFDTGKTLAGIKDGFLFDTDTLYSINGCFTGIEQGQIALIGKGGMIYSDII